MKLGFIGLGKMGGNMCKRLLEMDYEVLAWNRSRGPLKEAAALGATVAEEPAQVLTGQSVSPRVVWLMLDPLAVDEMLFGDGGLGPHLRQGDLIIDGGNSMFRDSIRRGETLGAKGVSFLDAGCSGGPRGAREGMSITVGGDVKAYESVEYLFKDLSVPQGYAHVGPQGAGHFVKMVHNAIEYGMMQSLGEGYHLLQKGPLEVDLKKITAVWRRGSVIRSFLLDLVEEALNEDPELESVVGKVSETGEARWATHEALEAKVPFTSISHSLFARYQSQEDDSFANRLVAALRGKFGEHEVIRKNRS